MKKRLFSLFLMFSLLAGLLPAEALAADSTLSVTHTDIAAQSVVNYEGYGSIWMADRADPTCRNPALIDREGRFVMPYTQLLLWPGTENQCPSPAQWSYICSEGVISLSTGSVNGDASLSAEGLTAHYLPDGTKLDVTAKLDPKALLGPEKTSTDTVTYSPYTYRVTAGPMLEGAAVVIVSRSCSVSYGKAGSVEQDMAVYLVDAQGEILCRLPDGFGLSIGGGDTWESMEHNIGWFHDGLAPWTAINMQTWNYELMGYLDKQGREALTLTGYADAYPFYEGLAKVQSADGRFGFIDRTGKEVIPCIYESADRFRDGLAAVKQDGKWGAIDSRGSTVIPFAYSESFGAGKYMTVGEQGKYGLVDRQGRLVLPMEYEDISTFEGGVAYAIREGRISIITESPLAYASTQKVLIDGRPVELQAYALKDDKGNPTNYVKLRDIAFLLNGTKAQFEVGWSGSVNILTGKPYTAVGSELNTPYSGDRPYTVPTAGTKINGQSASLSAIMLTDDQGGGYTYYQLRDLGRALGFNVGWSRDKGIYIETDKPYSELD